MQQKQEQGESLTSFQQSSEQLSNQKLKNKLKTVANFRKQKNFTYCPQNKKDEYWRNFPKIFFDNLTQHPTVVEIEETPVDRCREEDDSYDIFKIFDVRSQSYMAAKLPQNIVKEYTYTQKLSEQSIKQAQIFANTRFFSQSIAKLMAKIYREKTGAIQDAPPIFYASPKIYMLEKKFMGLNYLYAETYIDLPRIQWKKYSNNSFYIDQEHQYFSLFSHFTYEESGKMFIITDLQGKKNIFSDPSLQTNCEEINKHLRGDNANMQQQGIQQFFFMQHTQCNSICAKLGLCNQQEKKQLNQSKWKQQESEDICNICETCDEFRQISVQDYKQLLYRKCINCVRDAQTTQEIKCQCCYQMYQSAVTLEEKLSSITNTCQDCKIQEYKRLKNQKK